MSRLFSMDPSQINGGNLALIAVAMIAVIVTFVLISRYCFRLEKRSGKSAFSLVKIIMVAAAPLVGILLEVFKINAPDLVFTIITLIMCIVVIVWNIATFRILGGIMFSIIHIAVGLLAGLSIAAIIFGIIAFAVIAIFVGASGSATGGASSSSSSAPEYVRDPSTGESYYVSKGANGQLYLPDKGDCILRPGDYSGHYIGSDGSTYIS